MKNVIVNLSQVNEVFLFRFSSHSTENPGKDDLQFSSRHIMRPKRKSTV